MQSAAGLNYLNPILVNFGLLSSCKATTSSFTIDNNNTGDPIMIYNSYVQSFCPG